MNTRNTLLILILLLLLSVAPAILAPLCYGLGIYYYSTKIQEHHLKE